jgi:7,8-dihydropterin-6-yl-methyl-4-(beta-D-ribofuranosyl)aminobenzene 5'-phosphate synthase
MITRRHILSGSAAAILAPLVGGTAKSQEPAAKVTILFDAFGKPSDLKRGWGYSALIEYAGRRVLFDTGSRAADFAHNVSALGIDLKRLDLVILTHRHNDHTAGLSQVLHENPGVTICTPFEGAQFNTPIPPPLQNLIKRSVASVPDDMRYFGGDVPADNRPESPWPGAHFTPIGDPREVLPGFVVFSRRSETPGTMEMNEISLVVKTPKGGVLVVGCSHPGIEKIMEAAANVDHIYSVFGGFHLVDVSDADVTNMINRFRDKWHVERIAAGHCTGQFAFAEMARIYGANFDHAGVGAVIPLPA